MEAEISGLPKIDYKCFPETEEEINHIVFQNKAGANDCKKFLIHTLGLKNRKNDPKAQSADNRWVCTNPGVESTTIVIYPSYRGAEQSEHGRQIVTYTHGRWEVKEHWLGFIS